MLYPKNKDRELSPELYAAPTSEYRGAPFWSWNCRLEKDELMRQAEILGKTVSYTHLTLPTIQSV